MISDILNNLFIMARDLDSGGNAKLASGIYRRSKLLSIGENNYQKSHPFQQKYGCNKESSFWHSETKAIHNAIQNGIDLNGCTLYVARARKIGKRFEFGMAKPCKGCLKCIRDYGIKRVVFSLDTTGYGVLENV